MRRVLRAALWLLIAGGAGLAAEWAPDAMAELEYFRVVQIRVEGGRRVSHAEALRTAGIPPFASVWDDTDVWLARLAGHPLVASARVRVEYPQTVVFSIVEREPVAFVPDPVLEPVDRDGQPLPLDPTMESLDLPVLSPVRRSASGARLTRAELRVLAREAVRLAEADPRFLSSVSLLSLDGRGDVIAEVGADGLIFRFGAPLSMERLQRGLDALEDAAARRPGATLVDLRYADQVIVTYPEPPGGRGQ